MVTFTDGKQAPAEDAVEIDPPAGSSAGSATGLSAPARYYFNLTDGDTMIRDEEGIKASSRPSRRGLRDGSRRRASGPGPLELG